LVAEYNTQIVQSLLEGNLYTTQSVSNTQIADTQTYVIDEEGYPLTKTDNATPQTLRQTYPYVSCQKGASAGTGFWKNYAGEDVFGSFKCNKLDGLEFTFAVTKPKSEAFRLSNDLAYIITTISVVLGTLLVISIFKIANSVSKPINALRTGAEEFGKGNFDYKLSINTKDEFELLANSFNRMAERLRSLIVNLRNRDKDLSTINEELETEKNTIISEKNKLQLVIGAITDAVIVLNSSKEIIIFNKAAQDLTGMTEATALNHKINEVLRFINNKEELSPDEYCKTDTTKTDEITRKFENMKMLSPDTKVMFVNLIVGRIKDYAQHEIGYILTIHDVTREQQLEDMKLDFVSMAAHELRTPITSIRGYASMLDEELNESQIQQKTEWLPLLQRISLSAEQLLALVENLLNVTKIERGVLSLACKNEPWGNLIKEVVDTLKERATAKEITIEILPVEPQLTAYVDKLRISEVVTNLVSNAINYTQQGGHIIVGAKVASDKDWIETFVQDNGKGIPKAAQTHLFEKFFRVSGPLEQGSKGNGLGLYISKSIVEMHGGKIWVDSDAGKGAKFTFTTPKSP
jgi:two-component system sensor histidine kinase VicK